MRLIGIIGAAAVLAASGCGDGAGGSGAGSPPVIEDAQTAVSEKVQGILDRSPAKGPDLVADGSAYCSPAGADRLDCDQPIRDNTTPWDGVSSWRVAVAPGTGDLTLEERGPDTLDRVIERRGKCAAKGGASCE